MGVFRRAHKVSCSYKDVNFSVFPEFDGFNWKSKSGYLAKNITVISPINGHSKKRTPLISGRIYFLRRNSGQTLIKNFIKSGQAISGPSV